MFDIYSQEYNMNFRLIAESVLASYPPAPHGPFVGGRVVTVATA
jgi:hypothetical protein